MNENLKYVTYLVLGTMGIAILPHLALGPIWSVNIIPVFTIVLNSLIIPVSLLFFNKLINNKFNKEWLVLNFSLMFGAVCLAIYVAFLNWANWADKTPRGWGIDNVDKGTYMIVNLELIFGLGIIGIGLLFKIIMKITRFKKG